MAEINSSRSVNNGDNGLYTYDSFGNSKKQDNSHFLWWCAGVHQKLLKEFPSEHSKYAGLGGVILATFVLAGLSAGYAIYSVFGNWISTVGFAIIWGLIIFNFDRFPCFNNAKIWCFKKKTIVDGCSPHGIGFINWCNYCKAA